MVNYNALWPKAVASSPDQKGDTAMRYSGNSTSGRNTVKGTLPNPGTQLPKQNDLSELREFVTTGYDDEELRTLCSDLGVDYDNLRGEGKAAKVRELVNSLNRKARISDLVDCVRRTYPDFPPIEWPTGLDEETPTRIEFVNRAWELDFICKPVSPRFILVDGAAGYGKTHLLHRVKWSYENERQGWKTALIDLKSDPQTASKDCNLAWLCIANAIVQQFNPTQGTVPAAGEADEAVIIGALVPFLAKQKANVLLLFDGVEVLPPETSAWLKRLVYDLDRGLQRGRRELRVVFAGRHAEDWGRGTRYTLKTILLSPFDQVAVRDLVERVLQAGHESVEPPFLDDLAWWTLQVSGGHPHGICDVLEVIMAEGLIFTDLAYAFLNKQFTHNGQPGTLFELCIEPIIDELLHSVNPPLRAVLAAISPIRRFDPALLDTLLQQNVITTPQYQTGWDLTRALLQTHLIMPPTESDPMFSDQIVRRMLAMQLQIQNRERYWQIHKWAQKIFHNWALGLEPVAADIRRVAILESLYHALQLESPEVAPDTIHERLTQQLHEYLEGMDDLRAVFQLRSALSHDQELNDLINRQAGNQAFSALLNIVDRYLP